MTKDENYSNKINSILTKYNMTACELAEFMGITISRLSRYRNTNQIQIIDKIIIDYLKFLNLTDLTELDNYLHLKSIKILNIKLYDISKRDLRRLTLLNLAMTNLFFVGVVKYHLLSDEDSKND